jgi:hypothetical protein
MTLIFVYNADSGFYNVLMDSAHKLLSPDTYTCSLCALTHGTWSMKKKWADFLKSLPADVRFFHRDELDSTFPKVDLPAILVRHDRGIHVMADASQIRKCLSLEDLIELIRTRMKSCSH